MTRNVFDLLTLTAAFLCLLIGTGFAFRINITPNDVVYGLRNNDVSISCQVENSDSNVREVMLLELSKKGVPIALLRANTALSIEQRVASKFQGEGRIYTSVHSSYIRLTLSDPDLDDAGTYTCEMYYLDQLHVLKDIRTATTLSVSDVRSLMKHIEDEESSLRNQLAAQKGQISQLKSQASAASFTAVFSVATHNQIALTQGETVLFTQLILNNGNNYNRNTGVFTAPSKGLYLFQMSTLEYMRGTAGTDVRLVGGSGPWEGRVEVRMNGGHFGTLCDDGWDSNDAAVICRMLGYTGGTAYSQAHYGQGSGDILMDDVNCRGNESDVFICPYNNDGNQVCNHSEDAGVACQHTTNVNNGNTTIHEGKFYLKVNDMIVEPALKYNQSSWEGGSTISAVTLLNTGDKVKIVAEAESDLDIGHHLQFNGYIHKRL